MIKTERIYLKRFTEGDTDLLFQLDGDADVMKYITLGIPRTIEEIIEKSMPRILESYQKESDFGIFAAYLNNSDEYIGCFQFEPDKEFKEAIEIGWRLKKQHWENGYATEVGTALSKNGIKMGEREKGREEGGILNNFQPLKFSELQTILGAKYFCDRIVIVRVYFE